MENQLTEYWRKRNFQHTNEPNGVVLNPNLANAQTGEKLKFAVQLHAATRMHYDFRLEYNGVLLSWAVIKGPSFFPHEKRLAVKVEDHPLDYADFEGTIPKGEYGGGTVLLWDEGEYAQDENFEEGLINGSLKITLSGKRLKGRWALVRMQKKEGDKNDNWLLLKEKDAYAGKPPLLPEIAVSVKTGRTLAEIERGEDKTTCKNPMSGVEVMLARFAETVPKDDNYLYEIKYDGYRIVAFTEGGKTRLTTRNGHDYTNKFKAVAKSIESWCNGRAMVLDGEMIVPDKNGRPDFQALQSYIKDPSNKTPEYVIFDLLALDGVDLRDLPLLQRKEKLSECMQSAPKTLCMSKHVLGNGQKFFEAAASMQLEGIVGKKVASLYRGGKNGDWIKLKCYKRQEFIVCGYSRTSKKPDGISALLLGINNAGKLTYVGKAGTGIGGQTAKELLQAFKPIQTQKAPFSLPPKPSRNEQLFYLQPTLIAEVQYAELTKENLLRQASFKGLRCDKSAKEVVLESAETGKTDSQEIGEIREVKTSAKADSAELFGVKISSLNKIVFAKPRVTKKEVVEYYAAVAERMLPFVAGRILSVVRCHKGVTGECFFKKHPTQNSAGVEVIPVQNSEGETSDYFAVNNRTGLIAQAQLGTLEFHVWASKASTLEKPDFMVFDLDPDEGMALSQIQQGVTDLKSVLDGLKLESFLKTSGGKGYHVAVPFVPSADFNAFCNFAHRVAELMAAKWPTRYTANVRKTSRKGKIFIDWARNGRGATSVAPYSLRARAGACVSMPIAWQELGVVAPDGINLFEAMRRIALPDPWEGFAKIKQQIKL